MRLFVCSCRRSGRSARTQSTLQLNCQTLKTKSLRWLTRRSVCRKQLPSISFWKNSRISAASFEILPWHASSHIHPANSQQLVFAGKSNGKDYVLDLEFLHPVNAEASSWKVLQRSVQMVLSKEDPEAEFWVRLLKDKALEKTNVKIDWDKWVHLKQCFDFEWNF